VIVFLCSALALWLLQKSAAIFKEAAEFAAEFLGTFVLVFTVGCCVLTGTSSWNATAIACALMVMVYATGPISGGHLNPAVTLSLALCGKFDWAKVPVYCAAQVSAGVAAALCYCTLLTPQVASIEAVAPFQWTDAGFVEVIYTFMLCFVVNNCAASKRNNAEDDGNQFFGLAIGFVIVAGGYAAGGISGAAFNPAVALGLALSSGSNIGMGFTWSAFELVGAALAAGAFRLVRPEDYSSEDLASYVPALKTKLLAEFLGVFMLVLTVGLNIATGSVCTAWSAAAALMCMIYSLGDVSGGHFNPAVTTAVYLRGRSKVNEFVSYVSVQLLAGALAGLVYSFFHRQGPVKEQAHLLQPSAGQTRLAAGLAEFVSTAVLAYVVLATATTKPPASQRTKQNFFFGLAIASAVTAGGFAVGPISGGELNPAVALGIATASSAYSPAGSGMTGSTLTNFLIFAFYELAGGCFASLVFRVTHAGEFGGQTWLAKYACECAGTFVLVYTVACNIFAGNEQWAVTSIACSLMIMIYAVGPVSGGHLNPAVSFSLALSKKLEWKQLPGYVTSQLVGGLCGSWCAASLYGLSSPLHVNFKAPYSLGHAAVVEIFFTAMLCFVVSNCAASKRNNDEKDGNNFFALAIGFVIVAGGYAGGAVSGAAFNPAVAIGLDMTSHAQFFCTKGLLWGVFELIGAFIASRLFRLVRPEDFKDDNGLEDNDGPTLPRKLLSEFLGVFVLVFTVGLNLANGSIATAWSAAAALMCMIYSLGDVSGAHFNPAVTLAVMCSNRDLLSRKEGLAFVAVQFAAGVFAGLASSKFHAAGPQSSTLITLTHGKGYSLSQAGLAEFFATAVLSYIVLSCATVPAAANWKTKSNFYFALCIGSCVTAGGFAIGGLSGGELNPAVSAGIYAGSKHYSPEGTSAAPFSNFVKLAAWELTGGVLAATAFSITHVREYLTPQKV